LFHLCVAEFDQSCAQLRGLTHRAQDADRFVVPGDSVRKLAFEREFVR
jgi:hypothetical protein